MHTETTTLSCATNEGATGKSLAHYLLTAERVLMGVVLVICGVSGFLNLLLDGSTAHAAAVAGGSLLKAGFLFPLLKGAETLLQVWVNKERV